jgi:DNA replication protein DnaC
VPDRRSNEPRAAIQIGRARTSVTVERDHRVCDVTALLKIDRCDSCREETPWDWVPPVLLGGRALAGTGVWQSALLDGLCARCAQAREAGRIRERRVRALREEFIRLLGGVKPYRDFTLERFQVTPGNSIAFQHAKQFDPSKDNLYLWGTGGVGKTHLAVAVLRQWFGRGASIALVTPFQLIRKLRMKTPEEEQQTLDTFVRARVFVLDDLGTGSDTPYGRQVLQEILDARDFKDRRGLIVTSKYSPTRLAQNLNDSPIPSRLAGMCDLLELNGVDRRRAGRRLPADLGTKDCT